MKKALILCFAILIIACNETPKDYATLSGKITNIAKNNTLVIKDKKGKLLKTITVNPDGTFKDTLKVIEGKYMFKYGAEYGELFLKNDYDIKLSLDTENFDETMKFTGRGAESSNYLVEKSLLQEKKFTEKLFYLDEPTFKTEIDVIITDFLSFVDGTKGIAPSLMKQEKEDLSKMKNALIMQHKQIQEKTKTLNKLIGNVSPSFDYENYNGGTTSLSDLKGKYVYIDVWATWCGPCKKEIPSLKKLEKQYHGKNIEFVSISIDDERAHKGSLDNAKKAWRTMIADKKMSGVQLFSNKAWNSDFIRSYGINSIPRFILISPEGKVINPDAPRPSNVALTELFKSFNI